MDNNLINYLNDLSKLGTSEGFLMGIGGGSTLFFMSIAVIIITGILGYIHTRFLQDNEYKLQDYFERKSNYIRNINIYNKKQKESLENISLNSNINKMDYPIFKKNFSFEIFSKEKLFENIFSGFCILGIVLFFCSLFVGMHNEKVITKYLEDNFDKSMISDYVNTYDVNKLDLLHNVESGSSYYVVLYKNNGHIKKYNYYGNINIGENNKIKFVNTGLMDFIIEKEKSGELEIDFNLYHLLNDMYLYDLEVREDFLYK